MLGPRFESRRIHLQPAALGLWDPGCAPGLRVGAPARRHQQSIGGDCHPGLQVDDDSRGFVRRSGGLLFDADTQVASHQRDAVGLHVRTERGAGFRFLEPKECRSRLDDRDPGAEAREGLPELDADRAAAENGQRQRQLPRHGCLAAGPEFDRIQARDGWNRRGAPGGDHDAAARDELVASDRDRTPVGQFPFTPEEPGPGRLQFSRGAAVVEVACHPQHAFRDLREINRPFHA